MFISRLFAPKWKHKNPLIRKQALALLDVNQDASQKIFVDVAANDAEIYLRRFAISKLNDIDCVHAMRKSDIDYLLIEDLTKRLCQLLAGACDPEGTDHNVDYFCKKLDEIGEAQLIDYVAHHGKGVSLRRYALAKIENESLLADIAMTDSDEQVRVDALERITLPAALERIVKNARRKDKHIHAMAQQKLTAWQQQQKARITQQKNSQRIGTDIVELVNLCSHSQQWLKNEVRLVDLFNAWDELAKHQQDDLAVIDPALGASVGQAKAQFQQGLKQQQEREEAHAREAQAYAPVFDQMQKICDSLENNINELQLPADSRDESLADASDVAESMDAQWQQLKRQYHEGTNPAVGTREKFKALNDQYDALVNALLLGIKEANALGEYIAELNKLTKSAGKLLKKTGPIAAKELDKLQQQYLAIKAPNKMIPPVGLQQRFEELLAEISTVQQQQVSRQKERVAEIGTLTAQLEESIAKGKTKHALNLVNRGKKLFRELSETDSRILQKQGVTGSFQNAELRIKELTDWRQWSSQPVKEQLCESMELLGDEINADQDKADYDYSTAVQQIKQARQEWRRICTGEVDSDEQIWKRFDQACNRAYEPCQKHFDEQATERQLNYEKREKFCEDLESYCLKVSQNISQLGENIDWKALSKILQVARQEWQQLGVVNRADKDKIYQRFKLIVTKIDALNREHKLQNYDEKQMLIKRAKTVHASLGDGNVPLDEAIASIKDLQGKWKNIGPAKQDKQLWIEFRAACDDIFSRRQAEMDVMRQAREDENAKRDAICKEIEHIAQLTGDEFRQARSTMKKLKNDWHEMGELKKQQALERHYQRACRSYDEQEKRINSEVLAQAKQAINQNAEACYQLEKELFECLAVECDVALLLHLADKAQQAWCSSHHKNNAVDKAVNARFNAVVGWVKKLQRQDKTAVLNEIKSQEAEIVEKKELLCLEVEILTNTESPPDKKQARMEYQVSQLANKMRQIEQLSLEQELEGLLISWHQAGLLTTELNETLESRFFSALQVVDKEYRCAI